MLALCPLLLRGQSLTNAGAPDWTGGRQRCLRPPPTAPPRKAAPGLQLPCRTTLAGDSSVAQPEPAPASGVPVVWEARNQRRAGNIWTLTGDVVVRYRGYILRADRWSTTNPPRSWTRKATCG